MVDVRTIIEKKRDGQQLSSIDIQEMVQASVEGQCTQAQIAAFLSFSYAQGLDQSETVALTKAMTNFGKRLH